ncbi:nuclear transport factor 2 family protein [Frankia sp. AiPs1]|nr:nuclear transport factor 2 family protein [Frankia sp. AiPs1]
MAGDVATQQESFSAGADVVRVDGDGPLIGPTALAAYRAARPTPGPRRLRALHSVLSPGQTVVTVSTNERLGPDGRVLGLSTQTQVWARAEDGWRVIAACVAPMSDGNPAVASSAGAWSAGASCAGASSVDAPSADAPPVDPPGVDPPGVDSAGMDPSGGGW